MQLPVKEIQTQMRGEKTISIPNKKKWSIVFKRHVIDQKNQELRLLYSITNQKVHNGKNEQIYIFSESKKKIITNLSSCYYYSTSVIISFKYLTMWCKISNTTFAGSNHLIFICKSYKILFKLVSQKLQPSG